MMNVQTMRLVVDPIQRGLVPGAATAAAARWDGSSLSFVRSSANHVFRFRQGDQERYLRLAPASERRRDAIQAELDFVLHVSRAGVAVARPVPSTRGAPIEAVEADGQHYHAVVFEALRGRQVEWDDLDEPGYRAWGRALAHLHLASLTFPARADRPSWRDELRAALVTLPPDEGGVAEVLRSGLAWLDALPSGDHGLLHGDFELDNLVWDGDRCQALDFDSAVYGWYAVDVAIAVEDVWRGGGTDRDARLAWFFDGYGQVRPLPDLVPAALPRLLALLSAVKVARLLDAYATTDDGSAPAWLAEMRARHRDWLAVRRAELRSG